MNTAVTSNSGIKSPPIDIEELKRRGKTFRENSGASIVDIGDRVALVEFHTKANSLTDDVIDMVRLAVEEGSKQFDALVIGNRGRHFSAGANLQFLLESVRAANWKATDQVFGRLQDTNMMLKYGPIPVVTAAFSNALGGGCEIVMHSSRVLATEDLHLGLVEAGVGLIPAGGGTKELGLRALSNFAENGNTDLITALQKAFEVILYYRISKDGNEAKQLYLTAKDVVVPSKEPPIEAAKQVALELVKAGYRTSGPDTNIPVPGKSGMAIFQNIITHLLGSKAITEHDAVIAQHIAKVLCGGDVPSGFASEQRFLDLEREAFLSLLGTAKTQERIEYLLKNNKRLHN